MKQDEIISNYQTLFNKENKSAQVVLSDLADFCFLLKPLSCQDSSSRFDSIQSARLEGRREVILKILNNLNLNLAQLQETLRAQEKESKKWT